jgi:hypothetical protein
MKKTLLIFMILVAILVLAKVLYNRYCASTPQGCTKEVFEEDDCSPREGIDY